MPEPQFTVSPSGFTTITPEGVVVIDHLALPQPVGDRSKPVRVGVHHDLTLQLHGDNFCASVKLTPSDALGLVNLLAYLVRERI